jgi:glycerol uptake facilitator-like aquaporin
MNAGQLADVHPLSWDAILRQAVAPTASAFAVFLVVFVWFARQAGHADAAPGSRLGNLAWAQLIRSVLRTLVSGYLVFALIIGIFYFVLGDEPRDFVPQSLVQGLVLGFGIVLPAFVILTAAECAVRRRLRKRSCGLGAQ